MSGTSIIAKIFVPLTLYLLVSSVDNLCKQFGPRSGATFLSGYKLFDTLLVFSKEFFKKKIDFEKNHQTTKTHAKVPSRQRVKLSVLF